MMDFVYMILSMMVVGCVSLLTLGLLGVFKKEKGR
jgi:hypothetical protein